MFVSRIKNHERISEFRGKSMANLVIVESPSKATTIKGYLGSNYKVIACKGHIRDLPKSTLGVDLEKDFTPHYINIRGRGDVIAQLKKEAKSAKAVYLATDPDREGEAISWHLATVLGIPLNKACRVTFNEITKSAVKEAIKHPRAIDEDLVNSQQARRILDRIVGYKLGPFLWKNVKSGLSAGRVQSVATRIIAEREEEILRTNWVPPHFKDLWINMFYMFTRCAYQSAVTVTSLFHRASLIQQEIGCDPVKCRVIPNGVDYDALRKIPAKAPNGLIDIGAVVRLVPIKDIKTMLYAFSHVAAERSDVRLHIMGPTDEDEEYFEECQHIKQDMGLDGVIFTGRVNIQEYMEKLDFTLLTSISEGQPLAVLEAMAAGRPAVTTDVGCCRELIEGVDDGFGPAGICVPAMHQTALAEAVLTLCEDVERRRQYGENGRRRVSRMYRLPDMVERYEILFERARRGAGGRNRV